MKRTWISILVFILATGISFAYLMQWSTSKKPTLSLPEAYGLAMQSLGSLTNDYHCIAAKTQISGLGPNWKFVFFNTNSPSKVTDSKLVFVYFDKSKKPQVVNALDENN
jgi:hypothetical protein